MLKFDNESDETSDVAPGRRNKNQNQQEIEDNFVQPSEPGHAQQQSNRPLFQIKTEAISTIESNSRSGSAGDSGENQRFCCWQFFWDRFWLWFAFKKGIKLWFAFELWFQVKTWGIKNCGKFCFAFSLSICC
jgi:hypothetical protein